jgi:2-oxoglutarate dehydrogenase complex dehydrogenase (E1) component-like enzyme
MDVQQQTAQIIDLASYRKARTAEPVVPHMAAPMMTMPVAWMPVWVMVPVPVTYPVATA